MDSTALVCPSALWLQVNRDALLPAGRVVLEDMMLPLKSEKHKTKVAWSNEQVRTLKKSLSNIHHANRILLAFSFLKNWISDYRKCLMKDLMGDHLNDRSPWWQPVQMTDYPDDSLSRWQITLMTACPDDRLPWRQPVQMTDYPDDSLSRRQITLMTACPDDWLPWRQPVQTTDYPNERPPWWQITLMTACPDDRIPWWHTTPLLKPVPLKLSLHISVCLHEPTFIQPLWLYFHHGLKRWVPLYCTDFLLA